MNQLSPWSNPIDPQVLFPLSPYNQLLKDLNWPIPSKWLNHWIQRGGANIAYSSWPAGTKNDWIWGLGLPFLTDVERYFSIEGKRTLFGISGLPGCGKTSLGKWLEAAACELNLSLKVVSMDDFYLPSRQLEKAMFGNPWQVPRALPGSHSIELLEETIDNWKNTGNLKAPEFDKALRNGLGDRCGWNYSTPQVLVLEGWFLGCEIVKELDNESANELAGLELLNQAEKDYQIVVQKSLKNYQSLWKAFERVWHLKAIDFSATNKWKTQQERNLQRERGASIKGESLNLFLRMIHTAIPRKSLESIRSNVLAKLSSSRNIEWIGRGVD